MTSKLLELKRDDQCSICAASLPAGTRARWDNVAKVVTCLACTGEAETPGNETGAPTAELDVGTPGASARQEYERRRAKREAKLEQKWGTGRIGRLAKFLSDDPQSTTAWAEGDRGEQLVAGVLADRLGDRAVLLHDRRVRATRGNIDHLAIASSGVWVIDAKRYNGKVTKRDVGGLFRTDVRLHVDGRDRHKLVEALSWQVAAVREELGDDTIPVTPALGFVGAEWPILLRDRRRQEDLLRIAVGKSEEETDG